MWARYMQQRGTFNIPRKLEQMIGLLTALYASANSKEKVNFADYMPYEYARIEKQNEKIDQEEIFAQIIAGEYQ